MEKVKQLRKLTEVLTNNGYLNNQTAEWQYALDAIPECIYIINKDRKIRFINNSLMSKLGIATKKEVYDRIHSELLIDTTEHDNESSNKRNKNENSYGYKERYIKILRGWYLYNKSPIYTKTDELLGYICILRDVTDRIEVEQFLSASKKKQRHLYSMMRLMCDNLPDLIWTKDLKGKFVFTNKACCEKLLNAKDIYEPVGKTDMYFANREKETHSGDSEYHTFGKTCMDSDLIVLKTEKALRFKESGNVKGKFMCLEVYKAPFFNENGEKIGTVGCARDITNINKK